MWLSVEVVHNTCTWKIYFTATSDTRRAWECMQVTKIPITNTISLCNFHVLLKNYVLIRRGILNWSIRIPECWLHSDDHSWLIHMLLWYTLGAFHNGVYIASSVSIKCNEGISCVHKWSAVVEITTMCLVVTCHMTLSDSDWSFTKYAWSCPPWLYCVVMW